MDEDGIPQKQENIQIFDDVICNVDSTGMVARNYHELMAVQSNQIDFRQVSPPSQFICVYSIKTVYILVHHKLRQVL